MPGVSATDTCSDKKGLSESSFQAAARRLQRADGSVAARVSAIDPRRRCALAARASVVGVGVSVALRLLPRGRVMVEIESFCLEVGGKT